MTVSLNGAKRAALVALISVSSLLLAGQAFANAAKSAPSLDAPPTDEITAEIVTINGSGCPAGTAKAAVSSDKTSFRIRYADYVAQTGPGNATEFRKNCQINLLVHIPQGFTFAIAKAEYRGSAGLKAGSSAVQHAYYYWAGTSTTHEASKTFDGPYYGSWNNIDVTPVAELVYAPCGETRNLNINTDLKVTAGTSAPGATNWISMSSASGSVDTIYHVDWKHC
jgi:hypothetical protein